MKRPVTSRAPCAVTVSRLATARSVSSRDIIRAVQLASGKRAIGSLNIVLASDRLLAQLHRQFMGDPSPTDVLTFDLRDARSVIEGEVVVSVQTAAREAKRRRIPLRDEVLRYIIHGTLHLVGYDDHTPAKREEMSRAEDRVLARLSKRLKTNVRTTRKTELCR